MKKEDSPMKDFKTSLLTIAVMLPLLLVAILASTLG
mgnify:CR=1 FL=1